MYLKIYEQPKVANTKILKTILYNIELLTFKKVIVEYNLMQNVA